VTDRIDHGARLKDRKDWTDCQTPQFDQRVVSLSFLSGESVRDLSVAHPAGSNAVGLVRLIANAMKMQWSAPDQPSGPLQIQ
jgi:hypothetical protein